MAHAASRASLRFMADDLDIAPSMYGPVEADNIINEQPNMSMMNHQDPEITLFFSLKTKCIRNRQ
jgi:hypothetical protein